VTGARKGRLEVTRGWRLPDDPSLQKNRRLGEIVYYTDLGRTGMTCDTCHPDGHEGGVLYSKTFPIRIYRSPTCRAITESPPFFTPSMLPSIHTTCVHVLARNRYQNPPPSEEECSGLVEFTENIPTLPNPFVGEKGALPKELRLPDDHVGDAIAGLHLFEGKAGCAGAICHPPPHFTADQNARTRGKLEHVGTPTQLALRPEFQDMQDLGQPPQALIGGWDQFPLLGSGAAGLSIAPDGTLIPSAPFALRRVLEMAAESEKKGVPHGHTADLSPKEVDDLLAYLMTL
jgi:hypothetical protein